ncbi:SWF or SNF family helicase [Streptomyces sp. AJS327]|uniref:SWF or SNF family helicase n=1 Tax=Streptomyces sp. AJS327 TaxID=2545265 RepID=UPI0015E01102|nr:SWF or SNF family helicase [Streptomyces sp. AJS327]MBA0052436.1 SWF or SNF family helicase [Streptomyces sp. AJS327]
MTGTGEPEERTLSAPPPARGRAFTHTWWGRRWLRALEETVLDAAQLRRGRAYARQGAVGAVTVRPGRITAVVSGGDGSRCRADVLVREFDAGEWDRLLDTVAGEAGHLAALLDHEMPPDLVEDAENAGVELLPGVGDLDPECACEGWYHCPHTAALSYQLARLLDQDPFLLLLMRGRGRSALVGDLQARSAAHARSETAAPVAESGEPPGVPAAEAYALATLLPSLPGAPEPVAGPGVPPVLDEVVAPAPGVDARGLELLAEDAAGRARRLLAEALTPGHHATPVSGELTVWQDAARMAATHRDPALTARLARGCGRGVAELELAARAWRFGGAAGLAVLEGRGDGGELAPEEAARARASLAAAWADDEAARPGLRADGDRWTAGEAQLRYGRDGRWWPFRREGGVWWPAGGPEWDPAAAHAIALRRDEDS